MCKNSAEIQSAHFGRSNEQATLHTGVIYHVDGLQSFTSISDSLRHTYTHTFKQRAIRPLTCHRKTNKVRQKADLTQCLKNYLG